MTLETISPAEARAAMLAGALLVDIREADEHAREHIAGALNIPLSRLASLRCEGRTVIFLCGTGMRTTANAAVLAQAAGTAPCRVMKGGVAAWRSAGLPTEVDRSRPLPIMRQVQIVAGALVLLGVLLSATVAPAFIALSAFVGAGLVFAGITGFCGMARLLGLMPWNRRPA